MKTEDSKKYYDYLFTNSNTLICSICLYIMHRKLFLQLHFPQSFNVLVRTLIGGVNPSKPLHFGCYCRLYLGV